MKAKKKREPGLKNTSRFILPGVGDGLVDPDFDNLEDAAADLIESVGAHHSDQSEDNY